MKKSFIAFVALAGSVGLAAIAGAASSIHDEIAQRLEPVGSVCLKGEDCASGSDSQMTATADAGGGMTPPEDIYNQACSACHQVGVAGAPKFGDAEQWAPRIEKGMDSLYGSVINGLPPGMPAKGMCFTCSEEELKSVTDYMVAAAE